MRAERENIDPHKITKLGELNKYLYQSLALPDGFAFTNITDGTVKEFCDVYQSFQIDAPLLQLLWQCPAVEKLKIDDNGNHDKGLALYQKLLQSYIASCSVRGKTNELAFSADKIYPVLSLGRQAGFQTEIDALFKQNEKVYYEHFFRDALFPGIFSISGRIGALANVDLINEFLHTPNLSSQFSEYLQKGYQLNLNAKNMLGLFKEHGLNIIQILFIGAVLNKNSSEKRITAFQELISTYWQYKGNNILREEIDKIFNLIENIKTPNEKRDFFLSLFSIHSSTSTSSFTSTIPDIQDWSARFEKLCDPKKQTEIDEKNRLFRSHSSEFENWRAIVRTKIVDALLSAIEKKETSLQDVTPLTKFTVLTSIVKDALALPMLKEKTYAESLLGKEGSSPVKETNRLQELLQEYQKKLDATQKPVAKIGSIQQSQ